MLLKEREFTIFNELKNIDNETGDVKIFNYVHSETMDTTYNVLFSNRRLTTIGENYSSAEIARIIYDSFNMYWNTVIDAYSSVLDIIKLGSTSTETGHEKPIAYTRTNTRELASYDVQTFKNSERETEIYTPDSESDENRTITKTSKNADNIIKAKKILQSNIIYDTIFRDVNRIVSLMIVESEV